MPKQKDKRMTLGEHFETADDLAIACHFLSRAWKRCDKHFYKTSRIMTHFDKVCPNITVNKINLLRMVLYDEFWDTFGRNGYDKYKNIYKDYEKRYKNISINLNTD